MLHFVNVLDYADAGKVDPHSPEDGSFDNLDLRHIRRFVQLDIRLRTQVKKTVGYAAGRLEDWARALLMLRNCLAWESILMLAMLPASS